MLKCLVNITELSVSFCRHTLKPYQLVGLNWLTLMHRQELNGILADEMVRVIIAIQILNHMNMPLIPVRKIFMSQGSQRYLKTRKNEMVMKELWKVHGM